MTLTTEILKRSTERFVLLRINPGRFTVDWTSLGGGSYTTTVNFPISHITGNSVTMTEVSTFTGNNQWLHNETTGLLTVLWGNGFPSETNVIIIYYYLFYTSAAEGVYLSENPDDSATTTRLWKPRILKSPEARQSFSGGDVGPFTIQDTGFSIVNLDSDFQNYLIDTSLVNDSFYNKAVEAWLCVNGVANRTKLYSGLISAIPDISKEQVSFTVYDQSSKLLQPAYMGDLTSEAIHQKADSATPRDVGRSIPIIMSKDSWHRVGSVPGPNSDIMPGISESTEAVCTSYNSIPTTSNNRTWTLCRTIDVLKTQVFGTITAAVRDGGLTTIYFAFSSYSNVSIGDTFYYTAGGFNFAATIDFLGTINYLGTDYNLRARGQGLGVVSTATVVTPQKNLSLILNQAGTLVPNISQTQHYTISETATGGGHKLIKITFVNNFESSAGWGYTMTTLNPDADRLYFRLGSTPTTTHGTILKRMLDKAGCTTNAASFTAANAALTDTTQFSIPYIDETEYGDYLSYCEGLLKSTLGYIKVNTSNEIEYELLDAPVGTITSGEDDVLAGSVSARIEYQDIITELIATNPHTIITPTTSATVAAIRSDKAYYLHGVIKKVSLYRHCLEYASGILSRGAAILSLRSERRMTYSYRAATKDLERVLGDDITLTSGVAPGGSVAIKVTSTDKSTDSTTIEGSDFVGL